MRVHGLLLVLALGCRPGIHDYTLACRCDDGRRIEATVPLGGVLDRDVDRRCVKLCTNPAAAWARRTGEASPMVPD